MAHHIAVKVFLVMISILVPGLIPLDFRIVPWVFLCYQCTKLEPLNLGLWDQISTSSNMAHNIAVKVFSHVLYLSARIWSLGLGIVCHLFLCYQCTKLEPFNLGLWDQISTTSNMAHNIAVKVFSHILYLVPWFDPLDLGLSVDCSFVTRAQSSAINPFCHYSWKPLHDY
jgi:hypothetical protein